MATTNSSLAVVTGASSGIGFHLALCCAKAGHDLVLAADTSLETVKAACERRGVTVQTLQTELASRQGVDELCDLVAARPVAALLANAGHGLGHAFLDQAFGDIQHVIDTNITGTLYLLHRLGAQMRAAGAGRILVTGSIAGFQPGSFQAVYNGSKAFVDSFTAALRNELKDSGVTVTCLMPGVTDTEFFERAGLMDTKVGAGSKMDPADVAEVGFKAMMDGEADVVAGLKNKLTVMMSKLTPSQVAAEQHRKLAEPGTADH
ncbi:SDR family NAD(P)-dependent oxidoreductase [Pseudorhodoferax sp.]|uniref:SDR family NAD(P)-dependent oxidoreductase n=1 Tax=Pseudorhodoferax sp. TaxID=1993553 RepID=UPI002DD65D16|nr:SDR family NAD(P)-dependent oxidoreductase [Pseudorhodoferax sp.]